MRFLPKRHYRWVIKYLILAPLVVVVFLNVRLVTQVKETISLSNSLIPHNGLKSDDVNINRVDNNSANNSQLAPTAEPLVKSTEPLVINNDKQLTDKQIEELKKIIIDNNLNPKIRNKHLIAHLIDQEIAASRKNETNFDKNNATVNLTTLKNPSPTTKVYRAPTFFVILIQVHVRYAYLKALINSLKETKYIEQTLVIFSHDIYDARMNDLVASIDFCAVRFLFKFFVQVLKKYIFFFSF